MRCPARTSSSASTSPARRAPTSAAWPPTSAPRLAVGSFTLDEAVPLESLTPEGLLTPAEAVRDLSPVTASEEVAVAIGFGKVLPADALGVDLSGPDAGPWAVLDADGRLLAVYQPHRDGTVKPAVVVAPAAT